MFDKMNRWANRWEPSIALVGVISAAAIGLITIAISYPSHEPQPKTERSKDVDASRSIDIKTDAIGPAAPAADASAPATRAVPVSAVADALVLARQHRANFDVIGLQMECRTLLKEPPSALTTERSKSIRETCLSSPLDHRYVSHFDRHVAGREDELLDGASKIASKLNASPIMDTDFSTNCPAGHEADFRAVMYFSWASVALKAFLLAHSLGLGDKVIEILDRGEHPQEALPPSNLSSGLRPVEYLSAEYRVMTTYQIDRLLARYSDDQLLSWAARLAGLLSSAQQEKLRRVVELYVRQYQDVIKPHSKDLARLYRSHHENSDFVQVNSGRLIGNFPTGPMFLTCSVPHIEGFWLRRQMSGTAFRFESLAEKFLQQRPRSP